MDKRGIIKLGIGLVLVVLSLLLVNNIFAETPEEEIVRLETELANLTQQLEQIDNGKWVNFSMDVASIFYENYYCDNLTGEHTVKVCNILFRIKEIEKELEKLEVNK